MLCRVLTWNSTWLAIVNAFGLADIPDSEIDDIEAAVLRFQPRFLRVDVGRIEQVLRNLGELQLPDMSVCVMCTSCYVAAV